MNILKRPPGDSFTFRLFVELNSKVTRPKSSIYIWSAAIDPHYTGWSAAIDPVYIGQRPDEDGYQHETELYYRSQLTNSITSDLIVLGIKDHLTSGDFNFWNDTTPTIVEYIGSMLDFYSEKKFIILTSVENLEKHLVRPNLRIVPWGGDITNHQKEYQTLRPVLEKNLESSYTFLSLNRNKRAHRAMLVSYLYALGLENNGLISCMFKDKVDDLFSYTNWKVSRPELYVEGFQKFKSSTLLLNDDFQIYDNYNNDNVSNFRNKLSNYYRDTFVEIISETSYTEYCFNLTEKTLNSVYGASFPILLCSKGSVQFLRQMGLDMFDDIVDHSYDNIDYPAIRLETAITKNLKLLTDNARTKQLWTQNLDRFKNNIDFCQKRMYNYYNSRSIDLFKEIINDPNF